MVLLLSIRFSGLTTREKHVIAILEKRNEELLAYLIIINDPMMERLVRTYKQKTPRLTKSISQAGYTVNKGEVIGICLNDLNTNTDASFIDELYFVVLHELAHICTTSVGHGPDFWDNFKKLREHAVQAGVWTNISDKSAVCGESLI
jgi:predicted metal-dependent hydrolase